MARVVRFIEEAGKVLAVVDPFQVTTRKEAALFYETVLVACIKEMSRRGVGDTLPLSRLETLCSDQQTK